MDRYLKSLNNYKQKKFRKQKYIGIEAHHPTKTVLFPHFSQISPI